ncbi:MAG TPA: hypothetical protein VJU18_16690 [Vicinamibacteria bacterium]|nr:hypothetical protein [Vicinamibacteria bacterium]
MIKRKPPTWAGLCALVVLGATTVVADTLVLRNGRRVRGELVSVRSGRIEFDEDNGRRLRYDTDEVDRIEFDSRRDRYRDRDTTYRRDDDEVIHETGRPRGMRERSVSVSASEPWTDTGIEVRSGQRIYFSASGRVTWGQDRRDGPEGERGSPRNPGRPIPNRPGAALIAKVGSSGDPFFVGSDESAIRIRSSGRLFLGINDDFLQDNSGNFRVIVYY